jgi:hypothetical protein
MVYILTCVYFSRPSNWSGSHHSNVFAGHSDETYQQGGGGGEATEKIPEIDVEV